MTMSTRTNSISSELGTFNPHYLPKFWYKISIMKVKFADKLAQRMKE